MSFFVSSLRLRTPHFLALLTRTRTPCQTLWACRSLQSPLSSSGAGTHWTGVAWPCLGLASQLHCLLHSLGVTLFVKVLVVLGNGGHDLHLTHVLSHTMRSKGRSGHCSSTWAGTTNQLQPLWIKSTKGWDKPLPGNSSCKDKCPVAVLPSMVLQPVMTPFMNMVTWLAETVKYFSCCGARKKATGGIDD